MKKYILLICAICIFVGTKAQVVINEDADVARIMQNFTNSNKSPDKTVQGWRIQISASVDRKQVESMKKQIERDYSQYQPIISYDKPYYKLKIGAFLHKNKAESALNGVKTKYKSAYLTRDILKTAELGKDYE